jgi:galactokinase
MKSVTAHAPGRVNVIGEHTDYTGGFVFPMAISLGVTATLTKRTDSIVAIKSSINQEIVQIELDKLAPGAVTGWAAYAAGAVWAVHQNHVVPFGINVELEADLPLGAGMSSSAAVECSVVLALVTLLNLEIDRRELARWAKRAENEFVGVPTGSMDQVASLLAKEGHLLFFDTRDDLIELVPLDLGESGATFAVVDTRAKHKLIDGGYAARRADCEAATKLLQLNYLRDVADLNLAIKQLTELGAQERVIKRLRHVVTENQRVLEAVTALKSKNLTLLGQLMNASHESLRDDFEVSCPELNLAVDSALRSGAYGSRMMGGGFGGSTISLLPISELSNFSTKLAADFQAAGFSAPMVYPVMPSEGARVVATN